METYSQIVDTSILGRSIHPLQFECTIDEGERHQLGRELSPPSIDEGSVPHPRPLLVQSVKSSSDRARFERKSWGRTCGRKGRSKSFPARCDRRAAKAALRTFAKEV